MTLSYYKVFRQRMPGLQLIVFLREWLNGKTGNIKHLWNIDFYRIYDTVSILSDSVA